MGPAYSFAWSTQYRVSSQGRSASVYPPSSIASGTPHPSWLKHCPTQRAPSSVSQTLPLVFSTHSPLAASQVAVGPQVSAHCCANHCPVARLRTSKQRVCSPQTKLMPWSALVAEQSWLTKLQPGPDMIGPTFWLGLPVLLQRPVAPTGGGFAAPAQSPKARHSASVLPSQSRSQLYSSTVSLC